MGRARRRLKRTIAAPATSNTAAAPALCSMSAPVKGSPPEDTTDRVGAGAEGDCEAATPGVVAGP